MNLNVNKSEWITNEKKITLKKNKYLYIKSNLKNNDSAAYVHYKEITSFSKSHKSYIDIIGDSTYIVNFKGTKKGSAICTLYLIGYDENNRIQTEILYLNKSKIITFDRQVNRLKLALRVFDEGDIYIEDIEIVNCKDISFLKKQISKSELISDKTNEKYLVLTNIYASDENLYRNGFVHRRVKLYQEAGIDVEVFAMQGEEIMKAYNYDGVKVYSGNKVSLEHFLNQTDYKKILIHFINKDMYSAIKNRCANKEILIWIHAIEAESWTRRMFNFDNEFENKYEKINENYDKRIFMKELFEDIQLNTHFIFISDFIRKIASEDSCVSLNPKKYSIIHNITDTDLFSFEPKDQNQRCRVLTIRPFSTRNYGNDMVVNCILELSKRPVFKKLKFEIYGDGRLHGKTIKPIENFSNVIINKKFLTQNEIANMYKKNGIFLCPTRWDTQGVSRCEAMASGMVAITNSVAAIPEFIDNSCGIVVEEEDYIELANKIEDLYNNPEDFIRLSKSGYKRVLKQTGYKNIITKELDLIIT